MNTLELDTRIQKLQTLISSQAKIISNQAETIVAQGHAIQNYATFVNELLQSTENNVKNESEQEVLNISTSVAVEPVSQVIETSQVPIIETPIVPKNTDGFYTLTDMCAKVREYKHTCGKNTVLQKCREDIGILSNKEETKNLPNLEYPGWKASMYKLGANNKLLLTQDGFDFMVDAILNHVIKRNTNEIAQVIDLADRRINKEQ